MSDHRARAQLLFAQQRYELAEGEWRLVLADDPDDASAHACLALCLSERESFTEAEAEIERAVHLAPDADFVHFARAWVLRDRNRFAEAATAAEEAIALDPDDANNRGLFASILGAQARWAECLAAADAGLALDPGHDQCANLRGMALTQLGRKDEAATTVADTLARSPESSLSHANQGWTLLHRGDHRQALEHFREALRLKPDNDWARQGLLTALKARNPVYRQMLRFFLFAGRQKAHARWAIVIGIIVGRNLLASGAKANPEYGFLLWPLIVLLSAFVYLTWLADPLMNLALRFDRFGRYALNTDQRRQSTLVGMGLAAAITCFAIEYATDFHHDLSVMFLLLSFMLSTIHICARGWPRHLATAVCVGLTTIAVVVTIAFAFFRDLAPLLGISYADLGAWIGHLYMLFLYGTLAWYVAWMFLARTQPKK